jgi:hypothetical protein
MGKNDSGVCFDLPPGWGEETKPSPEVKLTKPPQPDFIPRPEQIVARSRRARRKPLLHFALRIPQEMLDKLDQLAAEGDTSVAQVIRVFVGNALKRKRRSASVKSPGLSRITNTGA